MTFLGFLASMVQSFVSLVQALAWPVVILVLVLMFRSQVKGWLSAPMQRFKAGPVEVEFALKLAESETVIPPVPVHRARREREMREALKQLAEVEPGSAVLAAHERIYQRLREMVGPDANVSGPLPGTALAVARVAAARGLITQETVEAIEELTGLRNLVAHSGADAVTTDTALRYVGLADRVLHLLGTPPRAR